MTLLLKPISIEMVYDELDTNALNFQFNEGYLSIQTSVYLEEDEQLNEPYIEMNDQANAQCGGIKQVVFFPNKILIEFSEAPPFLDKHQTIEILLTEKVDKKIVDFVNNHLFLGELTSYSADFDKNNISPPVAVRECL